MDADLQTTIVNNGSDAVVDPFYVNVPIWTTHSTSAFVSLSFFLGIPGNVLVTLVHTKIRNKTVTDWMIFYIALCDILSLINAPLYVLQFQRVWALGAPNFLCKYHYYNLNSISMAEYFCCACIALERYYKVVYSKELFSVAQVKLLWIPLFLLAFGLGLPTIWTVNNNMNGHCMFDMNTRYLSTIEYAIIWFVALLSSVVMTVCYWKTGYFLLRKLNEVAKYGSNTSFTKSYKTTMQTTKMLGVVTVVFLLSANVPYISGIVFTASPPDKEPYMSIMMFLGLSFFINTFFNPFIYIMMSAVFRRRISDLCCCNNKPEENQSDSNTPVTNITNTA